MGITHKWNGTVLTITSDSGTSSADLQGAKGDTGCRGPQGRAGVILNEDGTINTTGYATEEYVDSAIAAFTPDLDGYATESFVNEQIADIRADMPNVADYYTKAETANLVNGYATETYVNTKVSSISIPTKVSELTNDAKYVNEAYVKNAIANVEIGDIDLTDYALKTEIPTKVSKLTNDSGYQTEAQVIALIQANMPASGDEVSY